MVILRDRNFRKFKLFFNSFVVKKIKELAKEVINPGPPKSLVKFENQTKLALELSRKRVSSNILEDEQNYEFSDNEEPESGPFCGVCFEEMIEQLSYGCEHKFCLNCITENLTMAINEGSVENMKCPDPGCDVSATEPMVRRLVSEQLFKRYETLLLKAAVSTLEDIVLKNKHSFRTILTQSLNTCRFIVQHQSVELLFRQRLT